ncbi:adenosine kinase [Asbolus verrucosus]|uniref:Adenosine kinase n=1 Tax=Asbolus verrucosus TaxID=1661398 RepID=A0A482VSX4_ASBVE|nr:adenosine kinase [Asbolus verrucosus]
MQRENLRENLLLGMGNPLLDISATVDKDFLEKYNMKENNAILADESHKNLNSDLIEKYKAEFIAGGSVQNTLRVAQWLLQKPKVTTFFGCVGTDNYSKILKDKAQADGVNVQYQYNDKVLTGTCAVLITGSNRSLCADLAAANCFTVDHIRHPENRKLIENAQYFYVSGFFLTVSPSSILDVAKHALAYNRPFIMNLSAPFISQLYKEPLMQTMPYIDVLFGNETEADMFAKEQSFGTKDLKEIALKICNLPKQNENRPRVCVITTGHNPVILAREGKITEFPVNVIPKEKIVDTNGAGDAFAGGFLSQYIQDQNLDVCVRCGIWTAGQIVQRSGCTFSGKAAFQP